MPDVPYFVAQHNRAITLGFLGNRGVGIGFSDADVASQAREWSPHTARPGRRDRLPGLDVVGNCQPRLPNNRALPELLGERLA